MITAYIGLGSNQGDSLAHLTAAAAALDELPTTRVDGYSSIYRSAAVGPGTQNDYLNAVLQLRTRLGAHELLGAMQNIESARGRVRTEQWGPRTLDLDLLLYGDLVCDDAELTLPHPRISERNFVLLPLREVAQANLLLPDGSELDTLVRDCPEGRLAITDHPFGKKPRAMHGAESE